MMFFDMSRRDGCPTAFRGSRSSAEKVGKAMEARKVDARFPSLGRPIPIATSLGRVTVVDHASQDRKVVVNPTCPQNRLRRRQLGAIGKGRFPHPEPGADGRNIILVDKLLNLIGLRIVLCN